MNRAWGMKTKKISYRLYGNDLFRASRKKWSSRALIVAPFEFLTTREKAHVNGIAGTYEERYGENLCEMVPSFI